MVPLQVKKIVGLCVIVLLLATGGFWYYFIGTPRYSLYKTSQAIKQHDSVEFNKYVDVDRVVNGLIEQVSSSIDAEKSLEGNPFKGLAMALLSSMKDQIKSAINKGIEDISQGKESKQLTKIVMIEREGKSAKATLLSTDGDMVNLNMIQTPERYWRIVGINIDDFKKISPTDLSSSPSSAKDKTSALVHFGEKASIGPGWSVVINKPEDFSFPSNSYSFEKPDKGNRFVTVDVEYSNESTDSGDIDTSNLTLKDNENHTFKAAYSGNKQPELLDGTTVPANDKTRGYLTFEIPESSVIVKAVYDNNYATVTFE